ncbi:MAG: CocE/NonD family hydrolase, partial [Phenylobacterium sp.]|nr:CocE/NonD family hydrolase [Phenylobacterium sp.]
MTTLRNLALCSGLALILATGLAQAQVTPPPATAVAPVNVSEHFAAMRDGVKLAANVYRPAGNGPWPVVVSRTPYLKDGRPDRADSKLQLDANAKRYTDAGYVFVLQDTRGKGHSEGFYAAFQNDIEDGYDTVEWVARQPWSNGSVGITGGSALGITANAAAMAAPPHLKAAYVVVAPYDQLQNSYMGGVLKDKDTVGWSKGQGVSDAALEATRANVLDSVFWNRGAMITNRKYIRIPIYNVGGWYDIFNHGNISNFEVLQNAGSKGARGNQKLLMGPFGHGPLSGDLAYPGMDRGSLAGDQELRWFDYWLKGIDNGIMDEPPVSYFMMAGARTGAFSPKNRMLTSANWPPANREVRYYLTPDKTLTTKPPAVTDAKLSYRFDPA